MPELDLDRIRRDANTAAKFVEDSLGTRVLSRDVPALCDEVERLRRKPIGYRFIDPEVPGWILAAPEDVEIIYHGEEPA